MVVIDDGVATGATTMATLRALQKQEPKELILAIPVGPPDTVKQLGQEADRVICLSTPLIAQVQPKYNPLGLFEQERLLL